MLAYMQRIGKSLMLPIAVLPAAALLVGIANALTGMLSSAGITNEILNITISFMFQAGISVLDNLGLLFAVGIGFGMSKDKNGAAAITALVGWFALTTILKVSVSPEGVYSGLPASVASLAGIDPAQLEAFLKVNNGNAFFGFIVGIIASIVYNKTYRVELPDYLAFFSGRRLGPIAITVLMIPIGLAFIFIWPLVYNGLVNFGIAIQSMGAFGAALYGFFNRLLIPFGLHHALNQVFWFNLAGINDLGNYLGCTAANFDPVTGICTIYDAAGNVTAEAIKSGSAAQTGSYYTGMYMAGFFPIMMFGLPGAALAMVKTANPAKRKITAGIMGGAALAAFMVGITEPIEFSFMFLAPGLYLMHAVFTGLSMFISATLGMSNGFGFSAGAIDFVLNMFNPLATNVWMILVQGVLFFFLYFYSFKWAIVKFNLPTPGRGDDNEEDVDANISSDYDVVAASLLTALGGKANVTSVDNCATRLRLEVVDSTLVDSKAIKALGMPGVMITSKTSLQVIVGVKVQFMADALNAITETHE